MEFASKLIKEAVQEISKLPGIGTKTALRLALHLLKQDEKETVLLSEALVKLRKEIKYCIHCHFMADTDICHICQNKSREETVICVVENSQDVIAIENTGQYNGLYHILGGVISPLEGVSPQDLNIETFFKRIESLGVKEVIFAISSTMEGDSTIFYLSKKLKALDVKVSTIARGIPIGSELEYTDEITLGRSIVSRTNYQ